MENVNPEVFKATKARPTLPEECIDDVDDEIDCREIFEEENRSLWWLNDFKDKDIEAVNVEALFCPKKDLIRNINDPEHPLTLEQLNVVQLGHIDVSDLESMVTVSFTPTIPHCSMATLIGLSIRVRLLRALPTRFKVDVKISPGTHASEVAVNKQLADKERIAAALENSQLLDVVNQCLSGMDQ